MRTFWFCETCKQVGVIRHDEHADVVTVLMLLERNHYDASDYCETGSMRIRVLNFTHILEHGDKVATWAVKPLVKLIQSDADGSEGGD